MMSFDDEKPHFDSELQAEINKKSATTTVARWPQPLLPEMAQAAPYPINALPPLLRDAAEAIAAHVQAPPAIAGQCAIGAVTYLAQTRVNAPHLHNKDGMPCSLFQLTLGQSGDRKSECRRLAFHIIDDAERKARNSHSQQCAEIERNAKQLKGKALDEYLAEHPLPSDPRTQYSDATFERIAGDFIRGMPAASWDTDEGGQLLSGASLKADTRVLTLGGLVKGYDNGTFERTRSHGNNEGSGIAYHRRLSIHLLAQPVAVAEALADPLLRGQGFLARFLFADAPSLAGKRFLTAENMAASAYNDPCLRHFWDHCRTIMASPAHIDADTSEVTPPVLELSPGAEKVWLEHYNAIEREQAELGEFATVRPFASRAGEIARRLAAVFACFEQRTEIDADTMRRAWELARYSISEWARYTDGERIHPVLKNAAALMDWLLDPKRADQWREFHRDKLGAQGPTRAKSKLRNQLLDLLVKRGHLLIIGEHQYKVNPALYADSAEIAGTQQEHSSKGANLVQTSADIRSEEERDAEKSALICTKSAPTPPHDSRASAKSALSAPIGAQEIKPFSHGGEI